MIEEDTILDLWSKTVSRLAINPEAYRVSQLASYNHLMCGYRRGRDVPVLSMLLSAQNYNHQQGKL